MKVEINSPKLDYHKQLLAVNKVALRKNIKCIKKNNNSKSSITTGMHTLFVTKGLIESSLNNFVVFIGMNLDLYL